MAYVITQFFKAFVVLDVYKRQIHEGAYDELIEQIMQKPITEMQELYNNREIEK